MLRRQVYQIGKLRSLPVGIRPLSNPSPSRLYTCWTNPHCFRLRSHNDTPILNAKCVLPFSNLSVDNSDSQVAAHPHDPSPIEVSSQQPFPILSSTVVEDEDDSQDNIHLINMARNTLADVHWILSHLDPQDEPSSPNDRDTQRSKLIPQRWGKVLRRERRIYERRYGLRLRKKTIDEMWDDALLSVNLPRISAYNMSSSEAQVEEDVDNDLLEYENGSKDMVSPILGLKLDNEGHIVDEDALLAMNDVDTDQLLHDTAALASEVDDKPTKAHEEIPTNVDRRTPQQVQVDAMVEAVSLLNMLTADEWRVIESASSELLHKHRDGATTSEREDVDSNPNETANETNETAMDPSTEISNLLEDIKSRGYTPSTAELNLILARLATTIEMATDDILGKILRLYQEQHTQVRLGNKESGPDPMTYRLLLSVLSRRLRAPGEALKVCRDMIARPDRIRSDAFLDGIRICSMRSDLDMALEMVDIAFTNNGKSFRPPISSFLLTLEMMKQQNLIDEALDFYDQVEQSTLFRHDDEVKLLLSLCHWPRRTRRGEFIDSAPLLHNLLKRLQQKSSLTEKIPIALWTTLINQISITAKTDGSAWNEVRSGLHSMLRVYPHFTPNSKLFAIGLEASQSTGDAKLAADRPEQRALGTQLSPRRKCCLSS